MDNFLLHIGVPKAGSTFLKSWFSAHPQLLHVQGAIAGFQDVGSLIEFVVRGRKNNAIYAVTSNEKFASAWIGAETYLTKHDMFKYGEQELRKHQAKLCTLLHTLFPSSRVLIVTRGFRSALRSGYSEYIKNGGTLRFPQFLREFEMQIRHWLDFNGLVGLYETVFGAEKLMVLPYELLSQNPLRFLTTIEEWLGVDHHEFEPLPKNESLALEEIYWYRKFSSLLVPLASRVRGGTRLYKLYARLVRRDRLRFMVRFLSSFRQNPIHLDDPPAEYLDSFNGMGTILQKYPRYAEYSAEYLWPCHAFAGAMVRK